MLMVILQKLIDLVIVNLPSAEITTSIADGSLSFCEDQTVRLSATEAPNGETYTYRWSSGETCQEPSQLTILGRELLRFPMVFAKLFLLRLK